MSRRYRKLEVDGRQMKYLRWLERSLDLAPSPRAARAETTRHILHLELQYRIVFDRQPMMRGF